MWKWANINLPIEHVTLCRHSHIYLKHHKIHRVYFLSNETNLSLCLLTSKLEPYCIHMADRQHVNHVWTLAINLECFRFWQSAEVCPRNWHVQWAAHTFNGSKLEDILVCDLSLYSWEKGIFWHFLKRRCNRSNKIFSLAFLETFIVLLLKWYIWKSRRSRVQPFNAKVSQEWILIVLCDTDVIGCKVYDAKTFGSLHDLICIYINFEPLNRRTYEMYKRSNLQWNDTWET